MLIAKSRSVSPLETASKRGFPMKFTRIASRLLQMIRGGSVLTETLRTSTSSGASAAITRSSAIVCCLRAGIAAVTTRESSAASSSVTSVKVMLSIFRSVSTTSLSTSETSVAALTRIVPNARSLGSACPFVGCALVAGATAIAAVKTSRS